MEKNTAIIKKLSVVAIILVVVTFSIIAFIGVYVKNLNKKSDIINDYTFSTEFTGNREYKLTLDSTEEEKEVYVDENGEVYGEARDSEDTSSSTEVVAEGTDAEVVDATADTEKSKKTEVQGYSIEKKNIKSNEDSVLTKDSYIKSKKIMEKRLETLGVSDYNVKLDEVTGNIILELKDDDNANFLSEVAYSQGEFEVIDSQTGFKLLDNSNVKKAEAGYYNQNSTYTVYLQITLDKEGTEKLKNISNIYVEKTVETEATSESTTEENSDTSSDSTTETSDSTDSQDTTKIDYIEVTLDGTMILKTYFGEEMDGGVLQIPLASNVDPTDVDKLTEARKSASSMATIINSGKMPNKYLLQNDNFIGSTIKNNDINTIKIVLACIVLALSVILVIRFGLNGVLGALLNIGYLALVSLVIRYTNVIISSGSIITTILVFLINFGFLYKLLGEIKNNKNAVKAYSKTIKNLYAVIMPVAIVAFVFSFMQNVNIAGIGMILFWGLIIQALYNFIFTRSVYVLKDK